MKTTIKLSIVATLFVLFTACDKSEGYSLNDYWVSKVTVENPQSNNAFFLTLDNGVRLWTAATSPQLYYYTPKDGQRIFANYTILSDGNIKQAYDHDIKLNSVYEILTKPIFKITPETQDSIGNDPVKIEKIELAGDFLDIKFSYWAGNKIHYINLAQKEEELIEPAEKAVANLEFRHNANGDVARYRGTGWVSFKLKSLNNFEAESIPLTINVKESDTKTAKYEIEYKAGAKSTEPPRQTEIPTSSPNIK